jgi:hypothetical protein
MTNAPDIATQHGINRRLAMIKAGSTCKVGDVLGEIE